MLYVKSKKKLTNWGYEANQTKTRARFRRARLCALLFPMVFSMLFGAVAFASAADTSGAGQQVLRGLGSSAPAKKNVSASSDYKVYKWTIGDTDFVQINDLSGKVLTAFAITRNGSKPIGIGSLPSSAVGGHKTEVMELDSRLSRSPRDGGEGQCPCSSQIVGSGKGYVIVVVTDAKGNIVSIQTIQFPQKAK